MKAKPLWILVIALGVLTFILYQINRRSTVNEALPLLQPEVVENVTRIQLQEKEAVLTLEKNATGLWSVSDYYGLPVDLNPLTALINRLIENSLIRPVTNQPERMEQLKLGKNTIRFWGEGNETPLWELNIGKNRPSGGTFVQLNQATEVFLAEGDIYFDIQKERWVDKKILDFTSDAIAQADLQVSETKLTFLRENSGRPFSSPDLQTGEQVQQDALNHFLSTLINARFSSIAYLHDPDPTEARQHTLPFSLALFNGDRYTLHIGRKPIQRSEKEETKDETTLETDSNASEKATAAPPVFIFYEISNPQNPWQEPLKKIALIFPDYIYNQIPKNRSQLMTVTATPEATDQRPDSTQLQEP